MDQDTVFSIVFVVSLPFWMGVIYMIARHKGRHWAWSALGLLQLPGLGVALLGIYLIPRGKGGATTTLQEQYARGLLSEQEYLEAMTRNERAA